MRDDIVGMLKNAIDHGGNPQRVAQSLINSGYPMKDVKEAFDYVMSTTPQTQQPQPLQQPPQQPQQMQRPMSPQQQMPQAPRPQYSQQPMQQAYKSPASISAQSPVLKALKPLPSQKVNVPGTGKIIALIIVLLLLIISLLSVIIFKDEFLDLLSL